MVSEQQEEPSRLLGQVRLDKDSEKSAQLASEENPTSEAMEANSNDLKDEYDLEKAQTQATSASHPPAQRIKTATDWTGPDDPGNPHNWPMGKKIHHFLSVAFLAFAVTVGSSVISSANQDIQDYFNVSRTAAIVPLTVYVAGLGLGPLIAAPLSEQHGRSIVYKVTGLVFILFILGAGLSKTFGGLIVCRLLAGLSGAPVLAVGSGTIADLFAPKDRAVTSTIYSGAPFLGPALGPVIGGFAAQFKGWQWTIWSNIFIASAAFLLVLPMSETYKKVILLRRAKKLNLPPPPPGPNFLKIITTVLIRPVQMLLTEPIVLSFACYNAFTFSVLFGFFPAFPYVFGTVYGFETWQTGLAYLGIGVGVLLAAVTAVLCDRLIYQRKLREAIAQGRTTIDPEHRLYVGMMGAIGLPIGLFWFAWSARPSVHWISPILAGIPFAWGNLSVFIAGTVYQIDVYGPLQGASAMAANGLLRYVIGGCFPLWTIQMYQAMGIGWATSLLGFVCVLMLPIPWVLFKFGPQIRARSRSKP